MKLNLRRRLSGERRSALKYPLLLVLVVTLFFWKTLLTGQFTIILGPEGVNQSWGWLHFWVRSIWQGQIPLWDPYEFAGLPFAGALLTSVFYPFRLLFALVPLNHDGLVSPRFYHIYLAFTHLLCAWFTFALLRELKRSRFASFLGACVFALTGIVVLMIWLPYIESCIWLPAIFLFLLRSFRMESRGRALAEASLAGACVGMSILTGGLAFVFMQIIFVVAAIGWYGSISPPQPGPLRRAHWIRMATILAVTGAVAGGLGAIQLLPANELGKLASRFIDGGLFPAAKKIPYDRLVPGVYPESIVSVLFPVGFASKMAGEEGFPLYIGALPFFLAITGIWRCWKNPWVRFLAGFAVITFAYSLGEFSFLHGALYAIVPFLWLTRSADRFFYLISFALSILAAFGLDALLDGAGQTSLWAPARRIVKWAAIAIGVALFVPAVFGQLDPGVWNVYSLLLILGACAWFAWLTVNPAGPGVRVLLTVFVLFDIGAYNWVEANNNNSARTGRQLEQMISLRGPAEFLRARTGLDRVRVSVAPEPNVGDVYGLQSVWGGGPTVLTEYADLGVADNLLNVRYNIKPASAADPNPIYQDAKWKVYENPAAFPRAWVVHSAVTTGTAAVNTADFHRTALVRKQLPCPLDPATGADETVHFRSYEAERMSMDVNAGSDGLLVLSEMYYPGWIATVNGKPAEIYQVDGALRGIAMSRGTNKVEMRYAPSSFRIGAALSLLTLVCVSGNWLYSRRRF